MTRSLIFKGQQINCLWDKIWKLIQIYRYGIFKDLSHSSTMLLIQSVQNCSSYYEQKNNKFCCAFFLYCNLSKIASNPQLLHVLFETYGFALLAENQICINSIHSPIRIENLDVILFFLSTFVITLDLSNGDRNWVINRSIFERLNELGVIFLDAVGAHISNAIYVQGKVWRYSLQLKGSNSSMQHNKLPTPK